MSLLISLFDFSSCWVGIIVLDVENRVFVPRNRELSNLHIDDLLSGSKPPYDWCDVSSINPTYSNTNFNSSLQCMQPGLSPCGFDRFILVGLFDFTSPYAMLVCFMVQL